jgi:hypothetical protein
VELGICRPAPDGSYAADPLVVPRGGGGRHQLEIMDIETPTSAHPDDEGTRELLLVFCDPEAARHIQEILDRWTT